MSILCSCALAIKSVTLQRAKANEERGGHIMAAKLILLVAFFAVMITVGLKTRKNANSVDGFVLGGRNVGPWLTAFAFGTSTVVGGGC